MLSLANSVFGVDAEDTTKSQATYETASESEKAEDELCLEARFPDVEQSECARFRKHFENDDECVKKLEECVQFRAMYEIGSPEFNKAVEENDDRADWAWASKTAIAAAKTNLEMIPGLDGCVALEDRVCELESIPQSCFCYKNEDGSPVLTKDGKPFIQYMSALLDLSETSGASPEVHATAIALYLERKAKSIGFENGVVFLIDTRKGAGWPNHNVLTVVSAIRLMAAAMDKLHPGRAATMVVYPVPYACVYIFTMLKGWMPAAISENVVLLDGSDGVDDPPPKDELCKYVEEKIIEAMEETRKSQYISE